MLNRRIAAVTVAATFALSGAAAITAVTANAGPTGSFPPAACDFESSWDKTACTIDGNTFPWRYSKAQEAAQAEKDNARIQNITRCKRLRANTPITTVRVKRGDTLWGLSVRYLHNGNAYTQIKAQNHLTSNALRVGQTLRIQNLPADCAKYL